MVYRDKSVTGDRRVKRERARSSSLEHANRVEREDHEFKVPAASFRPVRLKSEADIPRDSKSEMRESESPEPQRPSFEPSGLLAAETNQKNGISLKYTEPPESRKPSLSWRLYVFKPSQSDDNKMDPLKTIHIDQKHYYLIGKDRRVVDIDMHHPSISKQHAVIQHRLIDGDRIVPYVIDLESTNGTLLNDEKITPCRYYELRERDILKFGHSSREYILLNDQCLEDNNNNNAD